MALDSEIIWVLFLHICVQISGKWIFHAGTSDNEKSMKDLKTMESSWIELSPLPESDDMTLSWGDKVYKWNDNTCHYFLEAICCIGGDLLLLFIDLLSLASVRMGNAIMEVSIPP